MTDLESRADKRPERQRESPTHYCPTCGHRIHGIQTAGPGEHHVSPCGCRVGTVILEELPTAPPEVAGDDDVIADGGNEYCETCELGGAENPSRATTTYSDRPMCDSHAHMEAAGALDEVVDILEGIDWRHVEGLSPAEASALASRLMEAQHQTNQAAGYLGEKPDLELATDGGTSWTDLSGFQRDILEAIVTIENDGDVSYGLAIKDILEGWYGEDVNHGRLYPNLDELVQRGLVHKEAFDKRTNEYSLTGGGWQLLKRRAARWDSLVDPDTKAREEAVADGGAGR